MLRLALARRVCELCKNYQPVPKNHHHAFILTERTFDHSIQKCATLGLEINIYLMYISQHSIVHFRNL